MSKSVAIIGGGISGICSAYYLHKSGFDVSLFDSSELGQECSYGNAGLIVPSHFETLANPGILKKGINWMLNPNSPFFLKPRLDLKLLSWIINFNIHCNKKHVEENKHFLRDINLYSLDLYRELYNCDDFAFDFVGNMRDDLNGSTEVFAFTFFSKNVGINPTGGKIVRLFHASSDKSLVVA